VGVGKTETCCGKFVQKWQNVTARKRKGNKEKKIKRPAPTAEEKKRKKKVVLGKTKKVKKNR